VKAGLEVRALAGGKGRLSSISIKNRGGMGHRVDGVETGTLEGKENEMIMRRGGKYRQAMGEGNDEIIGTPSRLAYRVRNRKR